MSETIRVWGSKGLHNTLHFKKGRSKTSEMRRNLRVYLNRLNAETESFSIVLDAIANQSIAPEPFSSESDRLQQYLSETSDRILSLHEKSKKITLEPISILAYQLIELSQKGYLADLKNRLDLFRPRRSVSKKLSNTINLHIQHLENIREQNIMRDKYEVKGSVGSVGPRSVSMNNVIAENIAQTLPDDFLDQLTKLFYVLSERARSTEEKHDADTVGKAVDTLAKKDTIGMLKYLRQCSSWVFEVAKEVSTKVAAEVVAKSLGIPS